MSSSKVGIKCVEAKPQKVYLLLIFGYAILISIFLGSFLTPVAGFRVAGNRHEIYWNEKFTFEFPISECQKLTHLKFIIKDEKHFSDAKFVGETMVHLEGLITEGNDEGFIELPATPYNVVLDDDSYKGELKIGLRFTANTDIHLDRKDTAAEEEKGLEKSITKTLMNIWKISWWRFSFFFRNLDSDDKHKET